MIVFDLECRSNGHRFEGWFSSSDEFARQQERGLVTCPECASPDVVKAVMAPNVGRKGNQLIEARPAKQQEMNKAQGSETIPAEALQMLQKLANIQVEALKSSRWVGETFTEDARAMYYGEKDVESIHGQATLEQAQELFEEGIGVTLLPFPVVPPGETN